MCGDVNIDCAVNIFDITRIICMLYTGCPYPVPECIANVNGEGPVNIFDAVYLITYLYKGGEAPVCDCSGGGSPKVTGYDFGDNQTSGEIGSVFEDGRTIINLNNTTDIVALEIGLRSVDGEAVRLTNRIDELQLHSGQESENIKLALLKNGLEIGTVII